MNEHIISVSGELNLSSLASSDATTLRIAPNTQIILRDDCTFVANRSWRIVIERDSAVTYRWLVPDDKPEAAQDERHERVVDVECIGAGAQADIVCAQRTGGKQQVVLTTYQRHRASHTTSAVRIHGVSADASRMTVVSTINIPHGLFGVKADQVHKHLLLDQKARAISQPILEVSSDDVSCSHGAAIKNLDIAQLFYLQSRGYTPSAAREELTNAFLRA